MNLLTQEFECFRGELRPVLGILEFPYLWAFIIITEYQADNMWRRDSFCSVFRDPPVWIQHTWNFAEAMSFGPATSLRVRMSAWVYMTKQEVKERGQHPQIFCKAACYDVSPVKGKVSWPSASTILGTSEPTGHPGSIAVHKRKGRICLNCFWVYIFSNASFLRTTQSHFPHLPDFLREKKIAGLSHLST